ncbi:hypothetical protein SUGI_0367340 [Cryptomeria japonica]|uniref:coniferyl alcohol acyltransferase-like n=1 Tax=Cryptomeria japonica TaxID=3369 RepID=UPI002408E0A6|nr:coniferyl alcohol acyltransferase-like [Cryptomeria japonica]GLJ20240.1 hypothetical protein SUGI_0367340 [Cryptomeria japonica]
MSIPKDYNVEVVRREVVIPATVIQEHVLPFSNIDLTVPPCGVHVFFCYDKPFQTSFASVLSSLKSSLSRAFVSCSAFAGRVVSHGDGDLQMVCNGKGAEFSEAYADICIAQVEFYNPIAAIEGKLVPLLVKDSEENGSPVFAVQVTEFSCGGVVVGCTFDHRIADSFSANLFFTCWANVSRNEPNGSTTPSFTRSILVPRDPPNCFEIEKMYTRVHPFPQSNMQIPQPPITSRIYYLSSKDIEKLQQNANQNGNKYTKLEAFSAYLWKMLIQGQEVENIMNCNMGIVVDGCSRLTKMGMPSNYFGNVIALPYARARAEDIKKEPLSWSAKVIHDVIYSAANEEHFQSLVDFVEISKPSSVFARICESIDEPSFVVSSGLHFPLYKVDYGWGKPCLASHYLTYVPGYVMPTPSPYGDGSWLIYMNLLVDQLNAIESHPDFILCLISQNIFGG